MMKRFRTFSISIAAVLMASTSLHAAIVAHYQLEGNGNDNVGAVAGGDAAAVGTVNYATGVFGQAAQFGGGATKYHSTTAPASNYGIGGANERTITAWVRTDGWNDGGIWNLGTANNQQEFTLRTRTGTDQWRGQFWAGDTDFNTTGLTGNWALMSMTYEDPAAGTDVTRFYVNGQQVATRTANLNTSDAWPFRIGHYINNNGAGTGVTFNGLVDDVGVWDRPLTAGESLALYNLGLPTSFANLNSTIGLNYDAAEVDSLFDLHDAMSGTVAIDELIWTPFDDAGLIAGLGLSPGQIGTLGADQYVVALTANDDRLVGSHPWTGWHFAKTTPATSCQLVAPSVGDAS